MVGVTWIGGVNGISKTDFSSLKDRTVMIWPDNDVAWKKAALDLEEVLAEVEAKSICTVGLFSQLLQKWVFADKIPDDMPASFIKYTIHSYNAKISFTQTPLDEYLSLHQRREKSPNSSYGMDFDTQKRVGEIDDSLRKAAYTLQQAKDYEEAIKLLGIEKEIRTHAEHYEILSPDRSRSREDGLGMGF